MVAYGLGAKRLAASLSKTSEEGREILDSFWRAFPKVKEFLDARVTEAKNKKMTRCVMDGRLRWLPHNHFNPAEVAHISNIAKNMSLQAGNASITKQALILVLEKIRTNNWSDACKIVNCIHDEILLECKEDIAEQVKVMLEACMIAAAKRWIKNTPIVADAYIDDCWRK